MNNNLVPKVLTDKNGVVTTRMVNPVASGRTEMRIPDVTITPRMKDRHETCSFIRERLANIPEDELDVHGLMRGVQYFKDSTLELMAKNLEGASDDRTLIIAQWTDFNLSNEIFLREVLTFNDVFDEGADGGFMEEAVTFIHQYDELPKEEDYSEASEECKELIRRLMRVAEAVYSERYDMGAADCTPRLEESLRKLVAERPDDLDRILDVIKTRKLDNGDRVRLFLDTDSPEAIAEGIL